MSEKTQEAERKASVIRAEEERMRQRFTDEINQAREAAVRGPEKGQAEGK